MPFGCGVMINEEKRKKERKKNIINIYEVRFTQTKVSGTLRIVLYFDSKVLLVYRLFALLLARLGVCVHIPYVQDAILNLCHSYVVGFCWSQ